MQLGSDFVLIILVGLDRVSVVSVTTLILGSDAMLTIPMIYCHKDRIWKIKPEIATSKGRL